MSCFVVIVSLFVSLLWLLFFHGHFEPLSGQYMSRQVTLFRWRPGTSLISMITVPNCILNSSIGTWKERPHLTIVLCVLCTRSACVPVGQGEQRSGGQSLHSSIQRWGPGTCGPRGQGVYHLAQTNCLSMWVIWFGNYCQSANVACKASFRKSGHWAKRF